MTPPTLSHCTANSGHVRVSPRSEVSDDTVDRLVTAIRRARRGRTNIPFEGGDVGLQVSVEGRCLLATVWRGTAPILTVGVAAQNDATSAHIWRLLYESAVPPLEVTVPTEPRGAWCLDRIEIGASRETPAAMTMTGDFARCLAWAWIESL